MDVYDIYAQILREHPTLTDDMKRKLKINVSASYTYKKPNRGKIVKGD
jgi:urate oxidase